MIRDLEVAYNLRVNGFINFAYATTVLSIELTYIKHYIEFHKQDIRYGGKIFIALQMSFWDETVNESSKYCCFRVFGNLAIYQIGNYFRNILLASTYKFYR